MLHNFFKKEFFIEIFQRKLTRHNIPNHILRIIVLQELFDNPRPTRSLAIGPAQRQPQLPPHVRPTVRYEVHQQAGVDQQVRVHASDLERGVCKREIQ